MSVFGWDLFVCIARAEDTFETAVSWSCSVVRSCDAATAASQRSVCAASFTLFDSFSFFGMVPTRPKENAECVFMKTWKELGFSRENLDRVSFGKWRPRFQIRIFQFHLSPRDAALVCITPRCACKGASVDSLLILVLVRPGQTNKRGLKSKSTHSQTAQTRHRETADSSQGWALRCPAFASLAR